MPKILAFHPRLRSAVRAALVFCGAGWTVSFAVQVTDSHTPLWMALFGPASIRSLQLGAAMGLAWYPLLSVPCSTTARRVALGAFAGIAAGWCAVTLYFLFWPPQWNSGIWNILKVFYGVYWLRVIPVSALAGIHAAFWVASVPHPILPADEPSEPDWDEYTSTHEATGEHPGP